MNFEKMTLEELEARKAQIGVDCEAEGADTDALLEEVRAINAEIENRKAAETKKKEIRDAIAIGKANVTVVEEHKENRNMNEKEIRNSAEYVNAYADYVKSGNDAEVRALLTTNVEGGTVAVPDMVYDIVKTAWDKEGIMSYVKKTFIKGNLKVGFEVSSTGAVVHTEGGDPVTAETLVLGTVSLTPASIKKWVSVSDEALDLRGAAFLQYLYDELAYQIAKKAADELIAIIKALTTGATSTAVGVPEVASSTVHVGLVAEALGKLSDEAANPVVMMNKATWSAFKKAQYDNNFNVDPFEGLPVVFNNTITAFSAATTGVPYVIVGDLGHGAQANFPNGQEIEFKFDDLTDMTSDLVRVLGREYVGLGIVADKSFVKVVMPAAAQ